MIEIIIVYDDNDDTLGEYFLESYAYTTSAIEHLAVYQIHSITGLECTTIMVNERVAALQNGKFIFTGYCHGSADGKLLLTVNDHFVSDGNVHLFRNTLFYTTACSVGLDLGKRLISHNCDCFVGYLDSSLATYDEFYDVYIACETYALIEFLTTNKTIRQTFDEMMNYFDTQIDALVAKSEILVAMEIETNKWRLTILGDTSITSDHFHV